MNVANNEQNNEKMLGGITGKGFMPGVSGNPSGRPKGTMKDYISRKFREMTDTEKEQWILDNKIAGIDAWKMAEGNPESKAEVHNTGNPVIVLSNEIATKYDITSSPSDNS